MILDHFQLVAQLGASDDGVTYRAHDTQADRSVEVRVLSGVRAQARRWKWLSRRLRLVALVEHPVNRRICALALQHEPPYLALEGQPDQAPAEEFLQALPLAVFDAVAVVHAVAGALTAAHKLGLAHGRVWPGNFFYRGAGDLQLDFTGTVAPPALDGGMFTELDASFRAPEGGDPDTATFPADVYGLGCLLFWLLTGRPKSVLATSSVEEQLPPESSQLLRQLKSDETVPVERLIQEALAADPAERPSAQDIADRLAALQSVLKVAHQHAGHTRQIAPSGKNEPGAEAGEPHVEAARPTEPPEQLGRFHLLKKLGQGGMGAVYQAEDSADGSLVAIKVLRPDLADRPGALRRFRKEARLLAEVNHPNVARLLEVNEDQGVNYLVIEYVVGKRLDRLLAKHGRLDERTGLTIVAEVARALADAHERGIIHRDIKPGNILLTETQGEPATGLPRVKLLDFGLARHIIESASLDVTQPGTMLGTPLYMAPEQWTQKSTDARTDVYSLGATLFHVLTGRPPFESDNTAVLLALHCQEPPPAIQKLNPEVSEAVSQIVAKCLAKAPEERYTDAGELLRDLERLLRGEPASLVIHPRFPPFDPRKLFQFDWVWDLEAKPEQLWPYVSNTERLNRAAGIPAVKFSAQADPQKGVQRFGQFKKAGFTNVWQEHPFEWIEGRRMGVLREYSQGVFKWLMTVTELEPRAGGGTRLTHRVRIEPKNWLGRLVATVEVGIRGRKAVEQVYQRIDAYLTNRLGNPALTDPFAEPTKLSSSQRQRLERLLPQLAENQVHPHVVEALGDFLAHAHPQELARIRPLVLARRLGLDPEQTVDACLHGARAGLLVLLWDILCPVCRIPSEVKDTLRALKDHGRCEACNLDFALDFTNSVELIFRVHPDIRATDLGTYCIGGPVHFPHIVAQARVGPEERIELNLALGEGTYRLRGPQLPWVLDIPVYANAPASRWEISLTHGLTPGYEAGLRPGRQVLVLTNDHDQELLVRVERTAGRADALTAARASSLALFRELFPSEALSPGRLVSIATVTLLITQLQDAANLYPQLGDAQAFNLVHEHFRLLEQAIQREGGAVVKTVGEGIVAVFGQVPAAVRAGLDLQTVLTNNATTRNLRLRVGIHSGPALAATLNDQLDYFGATVNVAMQLLDLVPGGAVVLTHPVAADPQVAALLHSRCLESEVVSVNLPGQPLGLAYRIGADR